MAKFITSIPSTFDVEKGITKLKFDFTELNSQIKNLTSNLKKAESKEISKELAESLIMSAQDSGIIPYKNEYRLRVPKDKKGKSTSPSQYYYYERQFIPAKQKWIDTNVKKSEVIKSTSTVTKKRRKASGKILTVEKTRVHTKTNNYTKGTGTYSVGISVPSHIERKRKYWRPYEYIRKINPITKKPEMVRVGEYGITYSKKTNKPVGYYADRPPHLRDDNSYRISFSGNGAAIRIVARKKPSNKFVAKGGEYYGELQYWAEDANWDRFTDGTTSRWFEVALGQPVDGNIKIPSLDKNTVEANIEALTDIVISTVKGRKK